MAVAVFSKTGNKSQGKVSLSRAVFAAEVKNHELLQASYLASEANARVNLARVKTRGEVRGGGKKPWAQKGTGRARFGSIRNPIWRGGGVAFGPRGVENYSKKLSRTSRQSALRQALSLAVRDDQLIVLESFDSGSGKVKPTLQLLNKLGIAGKSSLLVVLVDDQLTQRAIRNLPKIKAVAARSLSVHDILSSEMVVLTKEALAELESRLGDKS